MFVFFFSVILLVSAGFFMDEQQYKTFESGQFMLVLALVLGNVGEHYIKAKVEQHDDLN